MNTENIDRIEKKVDRILHILKNEEQSTSSETLEIGKLEDLPDDVMDQFNLSKTKI